MNERRIMKGRLAELEEQKKKLETRFRSNCERVGELVNPLINSPTEMRIPEAAELMDELVVQQAEMMGVASRIEELQEALYG